MAPLNITTLSLSLLALFSRASAWGTLGHDTVAFIAQSFISPATVTYTQTLLNSTSSSYLASIATWADSYRYTAEGAFSAPLHYIDALDNPPTSCDVDFDRDCPEEGCIVSAIANYTARMKDEALGVDERQKALKWVVHFLGDIHQPLHVENLAVGGNTINVTFDGAATNLHHIWDSNMAEKLIGGYSLDDARAWAADLVADIKSGKYANASVSWLDGIKPNDSIASAMHWASDANAYVCSTVLPDGQESVEGKELDGAYYDSAIPVIQMQIAKAGYRLAAWLDLVVTGEMGVRKGAVYGRDVETERVRRGKVELQDWMVEARRVRRAYGWNCGAEGHRH
ncbi:hypothetical protein BU26DRAFT_228778 [Trematosphaeria pertusa]|uniref:Nuclease s1 n=1 Tax=Trematosphaeria pertusa TaxID=390896 RepID=A0A6A6IUZ8_9PLEO|nr:uncharacterized protein BU26DRAFT_228778 [Trematosphaeria pertusa]KAF2253712.1 hypothetical protein BU26DRAFT_228778 [Trematosphaeria pertusa]